MEEGGGRGDHKKRVKVEMGLERKELSCPSNNGATLGSLSVISKAEIPVESTRELAWVL